MPAKFKLTEIECGGSSRGKLTEIRDEVRLIVVSALERDVDPLGILFECLKNMLETQNPRKNFGRQTNDVIELAFELPFADSALTSEFTNREGSVMPNLHRGQTVHAIHSDISGHQSPLQVMHHHSHCMARR